MKHFHEAELRKAADLLVGSSTAVCVTGAGISAESGIPTFRDRGGLWERYDPAEYATIEAFMANPKKVWPLFLELEEVCRRAEPNPGHQALARLEEAGRLAAVVTQNVDSLHQRGGSLKVLELHGSHRFCVCMGCRGRSSWEETDVSVLPPRCKCGGPLKPDVVLFGEMLPGETFREAEELADRCDCMLVVGTSASVFPAAGLIHLALASGAAVIEVNPRPELANRGSVTVLQGKAGEVLPRLVELVLG